ncbi:MAG: hypothetical protein B7C24_12750, partial [Bacteroidetes bacterium 4572_77]
MDLATSILAIIAIALAIVFVIVVISFIIVLRRFIRNLDNKVGVITKDIHVLKEQAVDFMYDTTIFIKKATVIADALDDMRGPAMEAINNLKDVSYETKAIVHIAKNKTENFADGIQSITNSMYDGYMKVLRPIQRIATVTSNFVNIFNKVDIYETKRGYRKAHS